eukprot:scaffold2408_cov386-Prasinococcus_capsulatus_cf.AAC.13
MRSRSSNDTDDAFTLGLQAQLAFSTCSPSLCWEQYLIGDAVLAPFVIDANLTSSGSLRQSSQQMQVRAEDGARPSVPCQLEHVHCRPMRPAVPRTVDAMERFANYTQGSADGGTTDIGVILSYRWVVGLFVTLFILLALSMWGLFQMKLPARLTRRLEPGLNEHKAVAAEPGDSEDGKGTLKMFQSFLSLFP